MRTVETKVIAGAVGSGLGGALTAFTLWLLGTFVWNAGSNAADAARAVEAVPAPITGLVTVVIPAGTAAVAGWLAPHTHRPDA